MQSIYARKQYKPTGDIPHIIVCGDVGVEELQNFCSELVHPDHGGHIYNYIYIKNNYNIIYIFIYTKFRLIRQLSYYNVIEYSQCRYGEFFTLVGV